ncbi:unnamed protein product [Pedinophyceae sp. YPF-701]|nr:unnamed protein product [Pedinophyceae sp. YPF-701]
MGSWLQDLSSAFNSVLGLLEDDQGPLKESGELTKDELVRFFEASEDLFHRPEFLEECRKVTRDKKAPVDDVIDAAQRKIFESQGIQGEFGLKYLSKLQEKFKDDPIFLVRFSAFFAEEDLVHDKVEPNMDPKELEMKEATVKVNRQQNMLMYTRAKNLEDGDGDGKQWLSDAMQRQALIYQKAMLHKSNVAQLLQSMQTEEQRQMFVKAFQGLSKEGNALIEGAGDDIDARFDAMNAHMVRVDAWLAEQAKQYSQTLMTPQQQQNFMVQQMMAMQAKGGRGGRGMGRGTPLSLAGRGGRGRGRR